MNLWLILKLLNCPRSLQARNGGEWRCLKILQVPDSPSWKALTLFVRSFSKTTKPLIRLKLFSYSWLNKGEFFHSSARCDDDDDEIDGSIWMVNFLRQRLRQRFSSYSQGIQCASTLEMNTNKRRKLRFFVAGGFGGQHHNRNYGDRARKRRTTTWPMRNKVEKREEHCGLLRNKAENAGHFRGNKLFRLFSGNKGREGSKIWTLSSNRKCQNARGRHSWIEWMKKDPFT